MLRITKVVKDENDYLGSWRLSHEQTEFLLSYAINQLLAKGLAVVDEVQQEATEASGNNG